MNIKVVLFDLDGTLLPMNQETFINTYFGLLAKKLANRGYEPNKLIESILIGTKAMVKNDGSKTNEAVFWDTFTEIYGKNALLDMPYFEEYYKTDFDKVQASCGYNENAKNVVDTIKNLGYRVALATNPIFPQIATNKRIAWAGLNTSDFELYTTYENSCFSKPNTKYYLDILQKLNVQPEDCLMVGNDVNEDMIANTIGINVFLITDCLINKNNKDISHLPQGSLEDLLQYIKNINT